MIAINLKGTGSNPERAEKRHVISVPTITHEEAQNASDLVEIIREKYDIDEDDLDILYNAFVTVFVRGRIIALN